MIQILREFNVKEANLGEFILAFGPGGSWSQLFSKARGFRGISLLQDEEQPGRLLSFEFWDSAEQRQQALASNPDQLAELETSLAEWTVSIAELGVFKGLSQATVRPSPRRRR
jgi:heme-degrading monooxygenase HmoA